MTRYYEQAFAMAGDKADIPNDLQPNGSVSYTEGFGPDYQKNTKTDPSGIAFPRDQYNQFCYDVTQNLQDFQQYGIPLFIPSMGNAPASFSYDKGVCVRYKKDSDFKIYQSLVSGNTSVPTDTSKWRVVDPSNDILVYYTSNFGTSVSTGDVVAYSSVTRQFEKAISNNAILENAIGIANVENHYIQLTGVYGGFSGLTPGAEYYLSSAIAGALTVGLPSTGTTVITGYAISSTELVVRIQKELNTVLKYGLVTFQTSTTQIIAGGNHIIQFDDAVCDTQGWWDKSGYAWKPTIVGKFKCTAAVHAVAPNSSQGLKIYKNGSFLYWLGLLGQETSKSDCAPNGTSPPIDVNGTTDTIQLVWSNESSSSLTLGGTSSVGSFFSIEYLGK